MKDLERQVVRIVDNKSPCGGDRCFEDHDEVRNVVVRVTTDPDRDGSSLISVLVVGRPCLGPGEVLVVQLCVEQPDSIQTWEIVKGE